MHTSVLLIKGGVSNFESIGFVTDLLQANTPIHLQDLNGDGFVDVCSSAFSAGIQCALNKADGSFEQQAGNMDIYLGNCPTNIDCGKYMGVAFAENVGVIQKINAVGIVPQYTLELAKRASPTSWSHVGLCEPAPTTFYNDARWVDFDNDGDDELAVLTDNELNIYSFSRSTTYSYPKSTNNAVLNTSSSSVTVISSHALEADAVTACNADNDCVGIQVSSTNQWEAVKGKLSFISAPSQLSGTACRTATASDARFYLPKSCSDTAKESNKFHCLGQFGIISGQAMTDSSSSDDYFVGANLGKVEPTSLNEVPAACQFDSSTDAEDPDNIETCLLTAGNMYVLACAEDSECTAVSIFSGFGSGYMHKTGGRKQIGNKWVLVTVKLHQGTTRRFPSMTVLDGCYDSDMGTNKPSDIRFYRVESVGFQRKFKARVSSKTVSAVAGQKITEYSTCGICDNQMKKIYIADIVKDGKPQLILTDNDDSVSTALVVSIRPAVGRSNRTHLRSTQWTTEINNLKTLVPSVTTTTVGEITDDTFTPLSSNQGGLTINAIPDVSSTSVQSQTISYPLSCAVNERAVNGVCEPCPAGSTSTGVSDPTSTQTLDAQELIICVLKMNT